jgi:hypothetical protein
MLTQAESVVVGTEGDKCRYFSLVEIHGFDMRADGRD